MRVSEQVEELEKLLYSSAKRMRRLGVEGELVERIEKAIGRDTRLTPFDLDAEDQDKFRASYTKLLDQLQARGVRYGGMPKSCGRYVALIKHEDDPGRTHPYGISTANLGQDLPDFLARFERQPLFFKGPRIVELYDMGSGDPVKLDIPPKP